MVLLLEKIEVFKHQFFNLAKYYLLRKKNWQRISIRINQEFIMRCTADERVL